MLNLYRSNRTEKLVDALADVLRVPLADPAATAIVSVQSLGMRTWLGMELARRLGIWANFDFPFPRTLLLDMAHRVLGETSTGADRTDPDRFQVGVLCWKIMECLAHRNDEPAFRPLGKYLQGGDTPRERHLRGYQLACRIADLFDQYAIYRPRMIRDWERGATTGLGPDDLWQPILLRQTRAGAAGGSASSGIMLPAMLEALAAGRIAGQLPERIALFGISTLPPLYLEILERLSEHLDVHLFVLSPSDVYWGDIRSRREVLRALERHNASLDQVDDLLHLDAGNPLLASMGRIGRDFQAVLEMVTDYHEPRSDLFVPPPAEPASLLQALQADIFHLRSGRPAGDRGGLCSGDGSIALHACHGPLREVEVVRDQLRAMFEQDATLAPHDVLVMTPDIDRYAPLIDAVFGDASEERIPYAISDRAARRESTVIECFLALLELTRARLTWTEVFDLLAAEPVREKLALEVEDVERLQRWTREAGVRWGIDGSHRRRFGRPGFGHNTWRFGLDRLLAGVALPAGLETLLGGVLAHDAAEGRQAEPLGKLAAFCQRLFDLVSAFDEPRSLERWEELLGEALDGLLCDRGAHGHGHRLIRRELHTMVKQAEEAGSGQPVAAEVVASHLADAFGRPRTAHGFMSGGVTFCKLLPMRSIPFRVVVLMGMGDGEFPRPDRRLGFDQIRAHPMPGDRSLRADDRYQFLEAVLAARERLLITWVGQSNQDNRDLPPSVLVGELLDALDGLLPAEDRPAAARVVRHPLQPYSPRYFDGSDPRLFSFSRLDCDTARRAAGPRPEPAPFLPRSLPVPPDPAPRVTIEELIRFFRSPAAYLLERSLGMQPAIESPLAADREPLELGPLERYLLGDWLLAKLTCDDPPGPDELERLARARGELPLGEPGSTVLRDLLSWIEPLAEAWRRHATGPPLEPHEVDLPLGDTRLVGRLDRLWPHTRVEVTNGRITPNRLLTLWIRHLVLCCHAEDTPVRPGSPGNHVVPRRSLLVGRGPGRVPAVAAFAFPGADPAGILSGLVRLFHLGCREALRFFPATSYVWARAASRPRDPLVLGEVRKAWSDPHGKRPEGADAAVQLVFGHTRPLDDRPPEDETSFAALADAVYGPLLDALEDAP